MPLYELLDRMAKHFNNPEFIGKNAGVILKAMGVTALDATPALQKAGEEHRHTFPRRTRLLVTKNQKVTPGDQLNEGSIYPHDILAFRLHHFCSFWLGRAPDRRIDHDREDGNQEGDQEEDRDEEVDDRDSRVEPRPWQASFFASLIARLAAARRVGFTSLASIEREMSRMTEKFAFVSASYSFR